jgi:hypothetical protein
MGRQPASPSSKPTRTIPAGLLVLGLAGTVVAGAAVVLGAAAGGSVADGAASWLLERVNSDPTITPAVSTMATAARIHSAT